MENPSKETIAIAIKFAKWVLENDNLDYNSVFDEWTTFIDSEEEYFPINITEEDLFNEFLETYEL